MFAKAIKIMDDLIAKGVTAPVDIMGAVNKKFPKMDDATLQKFTRFLIKATK